MPGEQDGGRDVWASGGSEVWPGPAGPETRFSITVTYTPRSSRLSGSPYRGYTSLVPGPYLIIHSFQLTSGFFCTHHR